MTFAKKMMHPLPYLLCLFLCIGCASVAPKVESPRESPDQVDRNEIYFGESWPNGQTFALSARQAWVLRDIVWDSEIQDPFSKLPEGVTVLPASDFSYFSIYGKTFHFVPPSTPHNFQLTAAKQQRFDRFMADEFGVTARWQKPRQKGEPAGTYDGG